MVMEALENPGIEMLEARQNMTKEKAEEKPPALECEIESDRSAQSLRSLAEVNDLMIEAHLKEALKVGPVTKFNGVNVIKMIGDSYRLFFGEKPKAILVTFLAVNVPSTFFNLIIARVSQLFSSLSKICLGF